MDQSWQGKLEAAAREVILWLTTHSTRFRDNLDPRGGLDEVLRHFGKATTEPDHQDDQYLFFMVEQDGSVVGAGFFETHGDAVLLHYIGLRDDRRQRGIGSAMLAWYLGSLPTTVVDSIVFAGVLVNNYEMRRWCARFGADEEPFPDGKVMLVTFLGGDACAELCVRPGQMAGRFPRHWRGLTFRILYLGRHPHHLAPGEEPICD